MLYCDKCCIEHPKNEFYIANNKSKLSDGTFKIYPVYRCKKYFLTQQKIYTNKNKDKIRENKKQYHIKNKESHAKKTKIYRETNAHKIKKNKHNYYVKNTDKIKKKGLNTQQTHDGAISILVSKRKGYNKKRGYACDIDAEHIKLLIKQQNSKCIYCGHILEIKLNSNQLNQISVDRVDSNKIYSQENCVLSCLFCNLAKNDMDEILYKKFINTLRQQKYDYEYEHFKSDALLKQLISACIYGDTRKQFNLNETITFDQAKELLQTQNNKCAISEIAFINAKIRSFPFKMSIDRIDNSKGHTLENCQIVLMSINRGKLDKCNDSVVKYVQEIKELQPIVL